MNRHFPASRFLLAVLLIVVVTGVLSQMGCATSANLSPVQRAEITYKEIVDVKVGVQSAVVDLRAQHHVTDAQWAEFDKAQKAFAAASLPINDALKTWKTGGLQPQNYPDLFASLINALADIQKIYGKVKS